MKRTLLVFALTALGISLAFPHVHLATKYNYPLLPGTHADSILNGLKSICGCAFGPDVEGDGKSEIAVTNYNLQGFVHVFQAAGNNSIKLVWTSPQITTGGGSSTPRYIVFGDLDNDGRKEVIFQSNNNGIFIFEWDGVVGSHNSGAQPSQVITSPDISGTSGFAEYMEVLDVDGAGVRPGLPHEQAVVPRVEKVCLCRI